MLLNAMMQEAMIERKGQSWIIKGYKENIDLQTAAQLQWLEQLILEYDVQKPVMNEIEEKAFARKISKHDLKMYMTYLVKKAKIQYFQGDFMHVSIVNKYRPVLLSLLADKAEGIEVNTFKDAINASKRLCAMLVGAYESEKIVTTTGSGIEMKIFITQTGRKLL